MPTSFLVGHALTDLSGTFLDVDTNFTTVVERTQADLKTSRILDLTHPEDRTFNEQDLERLRKTGEPFRIRKRYIRPSGEIVWVENHVSLFKDGLGERRLVGAIHLLDARSIAPQPDRPLVTKADLSPHLSRALRDALADARQRAIESGQVLRHAFDPGAMEEDALVRIANGLMAAHDATAFDNVPLTRKLIEAVLLHVGQRLLEGESEDERPVH